MHTAEEAEEELGLGEPWSSEMEISPASENLTRYTFKADMPSVIWVWILATQSVNVCYRHNWFLMIKMP